MVEPQRSDMTLSPKAKGFRGVPSPNRDRRLAMRSAWLAACFFACAIVAQAQDRVIGLLALPEVFGTGACDKFTPEPLRLFATPDATTPVGVIRVNEYWTFHDDGGCAGLTIGVRRPGEQEVRPLPSEEYGYEEPGAVVLARRGSWFKLRLADGAAWLRASAKAEFYPLERLYVDHLTYLTGEWSGRLASAAGGVSRAARTPAAAEPEVRVLRSQRVGGQLWFYVEVLSHSGCGSSDEPSVTEQGWVPAHSESGERSIWFHSRGC